jgi:hypothetical protein
MKLPSKTTVLTALLILLIPAAVAIGVQRVSHEFHRENRGLAYLRLIAPEMARLAVVTSEARDSKTDADSVTVHVKDSAQDVVIWCTSGGGSAKPACEVTANLKPQAKDAAPPAPAPAPPPPPAPDAGVDAAKK